MLVGKTEMHEFEHDIPRRSDSDPKLRHINLRGLYDSIKTLSEGSFESKLHAMEDIWKTIPFLDPLPLKWEKSVGLMYEKILNTQRIASSLCSPEESQKDMEQIVEATLKITSKLDVYMVSVIMDDTDYKFISNILQSLRKIVQIVRTMNLFELQNADIGALNEHDVPKQVILIAKKNEKNLPHDIIFLIQSIEKLSNLCQEKMPYPENSEDTMQIVCATLEKLVELIYDGAFFENTTGADKLFSDMEETLKKILTLARTKSSFSVDKAEETHFRNILIKVKTIAIHLNELHKRLPEGEHLHISLSECFRACNSLITFCAARPIFTRYKIENAVNAAIAAIEWPLLHLEIFQNAKDLTLDFTDLIFRRRVFNKCVSGLIYECQLTSSGDLTNSKYLTKLFQVLPKDPDTEEGFQKRIEEVSKYAQEGYVRNKLLDFWTTIESETCEPLNDENIARLLEEFLKARAEKHAGDKTLQFLSAYIFGTIKDTLEQLSLDNLSSKTVIREEFADACNAISHDFKRSTRNLSELSQVLNPHSSKPGSPAETIRKCLTWGNVSTSSAPANLKIFELAADFIDEFKANELDKKEEISLFFEEVEDYLFEEDGETKSSILVFEEELDEINESLTLLAKLYFERSNARLSQEIQGNLFRFNALEPIYVENNAVETALKRLSQLFLNLRPIPLKPTKPITELCKLLDEIVSHINSSVKARDRIESFVKYAMNHCLEKAFLHQKRDYFRDTFEQLIDISAHSLENVLKKEILPRAELCLTVIKVELLLLSLDEIRDELDDERKWTLLQDFQTKIILEVLNEDEAMKFIKGINSGIVRYKHLKGKVEKICEIWEAGSGQCELNQIMSFDPYYRNYITSKFRETCADLMIVDIHESTIKEAKSLLENYRSLPNRSALDLLELLDSLERNRSSLTTTTPQLKEDKEIVDYFADMKSNFDKEDGQKCEEWADILEKIVKAIEDETRNAPYQNDRVSASWNTSEYVSLTMDYGNVYFLLTWDIRKILKKLNVARSLRFKGTKFELNIFLSNVTNLIEKLEKTSASEKMLLRFFTESEDSETFNEIIKILNRNNKIPCENADKLRNIMERVCCQEDKYKAKRSLRVFWLNVKTMVEKEFKRKNPLEWDKLDIFRLSIEEYEKIRHKIFNMADANLQQETWMERILYALNHPISYLLQLETVHFLSSRPKSSLSKAIALFGALFMLAVAFVMFGWSNMKNMIN